MAELFLKQGQLGRALAIYRRLAQERPDDPEITRRRADIEAEMASKAGGPMSFHEQIQRIVDNVPGAIAGVIMGFDGISIDTYERVSGQMDITTLLIEYSSIIQQVRRAAEGLTEPGPMIEMSIAGEKLTAVMRPLTSEIFLGVLLSSDGLTGKARYLMRVTAPEIVKDLLL
ncbi:tetratricopeptide repeat protein [Myxococcota bacterium]